MTQKLEIMNLQGSQPKKVSIFSAMRPHTDGWIHSELGIVDRCKRKSRRRGFQKSVSRTSETGTNWEIQMR